MKLNLEESKNLAEQYELRIREREGFLVIGHAGKHSGYRVDEIIECIIKANPKIEICSVSQIIEQWGRFNFGVSGTRVFYKEKK